MGRAQACSVLIFVLADGLNLVSDHPASTAAGILSTFVTHKMCVGYEALLHSKGLLRKVSFQCRQCGNNYTEPSHTKSSIVGKKWCSPGGWIILEVVFFWKQWPAEVE